MGVLRALDMTNAARTIIMTGRGAGGKPVTPRVAILAEAAPDSFVTITGEARRSQSGGTLAG
jgi:hypothetical protein